MKKLLLVLSVVFLASAGYGQNLKIGVRTGLCYYKLQGELETNETQSLGSGFHFAITGKYNLTENFGLRAELAFVQKSSEQEYNDSFLTVYNVPTPDATSIIKSTLYGGNRFSLKKTFNTFSIPIHAVYKATKKWELFGGIDFDFVAGVIGQGRIEFDNQELFDAGQADYHVFYNQTLNYNYSSDRLGVPSNTGETITIDHDFDNDGEADKITMPKSLTAYYYNETDEGKAFATFDMALSAGASYFINPGLYVRATGNYGLFDATKESFDHSLQDVNIDGSYRFNDHNDHKIGFQLSLGFQF